MRHSKIIPIMFVGLMAGAATSCTDNYLAYNTNPYEPTDLSADAYNVRSALIAMEASVIPLDVNTLQFTDCLLGGTWSGYLADSNAGFNNRSFAVYNPQDDWVKPLFEQTLTGIFTNYNSIYSLTADPVLRAVADVIKVIGMLRVTDTYGPVPYSKVGKDGSLKVEYDSQETVYKTMFDELDKAIDVLTENRTANFSPVADNVFGGKTEKWAKLANSLKLRMAMRICYADEALAKTKAEEVARSIAGGLSTNEDNAFITVTNNPFYTVMYDYNSGDSRIGADIVSYMNGYNDPRRASYFTQSAFTATDVTNGFIGLRSGVTLPTGGEIKQYSNMKVASNAPLMWMNAAETAFLKAEAALRGWSMGGSAKEFYNEGIRLSFEQWSASGVSTYLQDAVSVPKSHIDPVLASYSYTGEVSNITIKWQDATQDNTFFEKNLERIITQKWIANFPLGLEAWAEYRRTGYPLLMAPIVNLSKGTVNSVRHARRLHYPNIEKTENGDNVNKAISEYLQGPDNMGTDVWWAKRK